MKANTRKFEDALSFLESLYFRGVKLGLENTIRMLEKIDNPHEKLRTVHVGGTNGKGSICSMILSAARNSGIKTGLYTSPHLISIRERFRIDGKSIEEDKFANLVFYIKDKTQSLFAQADRAGPTYFEFLTVIAFEYFAREKVELAIIEVGMGGRLDSTNVITPLVSIISEVHYDHLKPLGNDLESIALEKAGIMKTGIPVICGDHKSATRKIIHQSGKRKNCRVYFMNDDFGWDTYHYVGTGDAPLQLNRVWWKNHACEIACPMIGRHQCKNIAVAHAVIRLLPELGVNISIPLAIQGFKKAHWPGRFQFLEGGILLDSAHNVSAIKEFIFSLVQFFPKKKNWNALFSVCEDKEWKEMVRELLQVCNQITLVDIDRPRMQTPSIIQEYVQQQFPQVQVEICNNLDFKLNKMRREHGGFVVGSIFLVGQILSLCNPQDKSNILDI